MKSILTLLALTLPLAADPRPERDAKPEADALRDEIRTLRVAPDDTLRELQQLMRDGQGRVRIEMAAPGDAPEMSQWRIGVGVGPIDPVLRKHLRLSESGGVRVTEVAEGSPAAKAGIERDDLLLAVNGEPPENLEGLRAMVQQAGKKNRALEMVLLRQGEKREVEVKPQGPPERERPRDAASRPEREGERGPERRNAARAMPRPARQLERLEDRTIQILEQLERQTRLLEQIRDQGNRGRRTIIPSTPDRDPGEREARERDAE